MAATAWFVAFNAFHVFIFVTPLEWDVATALLPSSSLRPCSHGDVVLALAQAMEA